jgi:hypothetical protein
MRTSKRTYSVNIPAKTFDTGVIIQGFKTALCDKVDKF